MSANSFQDNSSSFKSDFTVPQCTDESMCSELKLNIQRGNPHSIVGNLYVFILIILLEISINYDVGTMAIMVSWINDQYKFSETELGILGALPFFGLIVISTVASHLLSRFKAKHVCSIALGTNIIAIIVFATAFHKSLFYIGRFSIGITQALFAIYAPVWVDTYSPLKYRTVWMGIFQGSIIIGTVLGYSITALFRAAGPWGWRYSLFLQAAMLLIEFIWFAFLPGNKVNLPAHLKFDNTEILPNNSSSDLSSNEKITRISLPNFELSQNEPQYRRRFTYDQIYESPNTFYGPLVNISKYKMSVDLQNSKNKHLHVLGVGEMDKNSNAIPEAVDSNWFKDFILLFKSGMFFPIVFTLCALYFELTGIQYWITSYLIRMCDVDEKLVYIVFSVTAITSPAIGVLFGSFVVDYLSGYDNKSLVRLFLILFTWSLICVTCGIIGVIYNRNFVVLVIQIWIILFFGGCIVPSAMVVSINSVDPRLRTMASSIGAVLFNILGYMAGSILPGYIADVVGDFSALIYVIFLWSIFGTLGIIVCLFIKLYQNSVNKRMANNADIKC